MLILTWNVRVPTGNPKIPTWNVKVPKRNARVPTVFSRAWTWNLLVPKRKTQRWLAKIDRLHAERARSESSFAISKPEPARSESNSAPLLPDITASHRSTTPEASCGAMSESYGQTKQPALRPDSLTADDSDGAD
ncbi:MAG: hypothetical protein ABII82_20315 [Verrucomicrobiota bacterium]